MSGYGATIAFQERGGEKLITPRWNRRKYAFDRLFNFSPRRTRLCEIGFRLTILVYSIAVNYRRTRSRSTRKNLRSRIDALETFVQSKSLFATEFCRRADGATASRSTGTAIFPSSSNQSVRNVYSIALNFFFSSWNERKDREERNENRRPMALPLAREILRVFFF